MEISPNLRLTQTVQKGGCAAKVAATELRGILGKIQFPPQPKELIIGTGTFDDAAVYQLSPELALVQTLDFFTPIVDTPRIFGAIAAANALSDVYAMGGAPRTAMAILAFPLGTMDQAVITEVLQGACDKISESGAALVGGHTIDDDSLKFGLSVTGFVKPDKIWSNAGAKPGDSLILTKPLGTGTLTAALKRGETDETGITDALESMSQLNKVPELLSPELTKAIHAATDITGFGLAGHGWNLAKASGVRLKIFCERLPRFEKALPFLKAGFLTKAHRTNADYVKDHISFLTQDPLYPLLSYDPQTSGGLLLSVENSAADSILEAIRSQFPKAEKIGTVASTATPGLDFS